METNIYSSQGLARCITEKFTNHSDGYVKYMCRCGNDAIVNEKLKLYRCNNCGDNADICAVNTSWCSKLFLQELKTCNVGIKQNIKPYTFETIDKKDYKEESKEDN